MFDPDTGLLPVHVELNYDGAWHEITEDVKVDRGITVDRGRDDYQSSPSPTTCSFTLDNRDGKYSPKNPLSPLYGKIGRATPVRYRVGGPGVFAKFTGDLSNNLATDDSVGQLSPSGDIEIDIELEPESWTSQNETMIMGKGSGAAGDQSWAVILRPDGKVRFFCWLDNGSDLYYEIEPVTGDSDRKSFRFRFSPDGLPEYSPDSEGHPTLFVTHLDGWDGEEGRWLTRWWGDEQNVPLVSTASPLTVGSLADGGTAYGMSGYAGVVHRVRIRDGSGATLLYTEFSGLESETPNDLTGRNWVENGSVHWHDSSCRFLGTVREWPVRWSLPEDAETVVSAAGYRGRLDRSSTPIRSALYRANLHPTIRGRVLNYWPMEEGEYATTFASATGGPDMQVGWIPGYHVRDTEFSRYDGFPGSGPLPEFHVADAVGTIPASSWTGEMRVQFLVHLADNMDFGTERHLLNLRTSGSIAEWSVSVFNHETDGFAIMVTSYDRDGVIVKQIYNGLGWEANTSKPVMLGLILSEDGQGVTHTIYKIAEDDTVYSTSHTYDGYTLGVPSSVVVGSGTDLEGTAIGHVSVWNRDTSYIFDELYSAYTARNGELAADRVHRLATEEELPIVVTGDSGASEPLGYQSTGTLTEIFDSAAEADMALFHDRRDRYGLVYRNRETLYNQTPLILDYEADPIVNPFEPTDDDSDTANDVTVKREDGSQARSVETEGPMSVDAIGRYDESHTFSLYTDGQTGYQADWRRHLGTVDEVRYPRLRLALHDKPELVEQVLPVDLGDRVQVANLPPWLPPGNADVIVQGYSEWTDGIEYELTFNCTPASPWQAAVADNETYGRADTAGTELLSAVDSTTTTFDVVTTEGPVWIEDAGEMPFDVSLGGEVVTVTAVRQLLSDDFARDGVGSWDVDTWDNTLIWG